MSSKKDNPKATEQLEMFPVFDINAIKAGVQSKRRSSSLKNFAQNDTPPEKELENSSFHVSRTYTSLDFAEINIQKHEFENCTFKSCHFIKANLAECVFRDCIFETCEIVVPVLEGAQIFGTSFNSCKLMGLNFADCSEALFSPCFNDTVLSSCTFEGNNLRRLPFVNCKVRDSSFIYCNLEGSRFNDTDFEATTFQDCIFDKADFSGASGYEINPFMNKIKGGIFSLPEAQSFLYYLGIKIE